MENTNIQPNITIQSLDSLNNTQQAAVVTDKTNTADQSYLSYQPAAQPAIAPAPVMPELPSAPEETKPATPSLQTMESLSEKVSYEGARIDQIEVEKIVPNPFQPRKTFQAQALKELSDSIKEHGVIQPLVVIKSGDTYELVVGERRFRASQLAGLKFVPAIIKEEMVDQTKLEVALIENIQRQELNPIEEALAYNKLMTMFSLTQEEVAKKVGKSRPAVANTVRLLNLPAEVQRLVIDGKISEGHARALLGLIDGEKIILMAKKVMEENWTVRQVESKVRELTTKRSMDAAAPDPKLMALESELRIKLGAQVKIQRQGQVGKILIEFYSDEELNDIVHKMAEQQQQGNGGYLTV
jgi:ParB family chromosome partitioning protein